MSLIESFAVYTCRVLTKRKTLWREKFEKKVVEELGERGNFMFRGIILKKAPFKLEDQ